MTERDPRTMTYGRTRRVLLAATFLIGAATLYGEETDFRDLRWGMTVDEVKEIEGHPADEHSTEETIDPLVYMVRVASLDAYMVLHFNDDRLYQAVYWFREDYRDDNQYVRDFERIGELLVEVYGTPEVDQEEVWRGTRWSRQYWGMQVRAGNLDIRSQWQTDRTYIRHMIWARDREILHTIEYTSFVDLEAHRQRLREGLWGAEGGERPLRCL